MKYDFQYLGEYAHCHRLQDWQGGQTIQPMHHA